MPFYEIQHHHPLGPKQREKLAKNLTDLHARTFNAPAMFVNVRFRSMDFGEENFFVGGQPRFKTNQIFVHVRSGSNRSSEVFDKLAADIEKVWDEVVDGGYRKMYKLAGEDGEDKLPPDDRKDAERMKEEHPKLLQGVFIIPGLTAREEGFAIPVAGEELPWIKANWSKFEARSNAGDPDMEALIKDINGRTELGGKGKSKEEEQAELALREKKEGEKVTDDKTESNKEERTEHSKEQAR